MNYIFYKEHDGKVIATKTVPEEDIKRVADAAQDVRQVYRVEEIFHMIMSKVTAKMNVADECRIFMIGSAR